MTTVPSRLPSLSFTGRDFTSIQRDILRYIETRRPNDVNAFFEGDIGKILVELVSFIGDQLSYAIDRASEEAFTSTMRTFAAALRHAAGVGYPIATTSGAGATLVPVRFSDIPASVTSASSFNEVQTVSITGSPTAGTFTLSLNSELTVPIAYNAAASAVQTALENLSGVGVGNVSVTGNAGGPWTVTFQNALGYTALSQLVIDATNTTKNEIQLVTLSNTPTGTFRLTFDDTGSNPQQTVAIAVSAPATGSGSVQEALQNLSNVGSGNVAVTGNAGGPWTVTFQNALKNTNYTQMTATAPTGSGTSAVSTTQNGGAVTTAVTTVTNGADNSYTATFAKGTQFDVGGLTWEVVSETVISGIEVTASNFQSVFRIPVVQGAAFNEIFTATGAAFQSFTTLNGDVIQDSIEIRVGSPDATPWTLVDVLAFYKATDTVFTVRYTAQGNAIISFGDGKTGKSPSDGDLIYVRARSGGGTIGNVSSNVINTTLRGEATKTGFADIEIQVPVTNPDPASGGRDPETLAEVQRNIPAWIRTVDKAITVEDYDTLAGSFESSSGSISRAASYLSSAAIMFQTAGPTVSSANPLRLLKDSVVTLGSRTFKLSKDFEVTETDPIIFFNPNTVFVYVWSQADKGYSGSSAGLVADVRKYLQDRSVVTTTIVVLPGKQRIINIDLGDVYYYENVSEATVRQAIIDAVRTFFLSDDTQPGKPFRLSDFYSALESVNGVNHFVIQTPTSDVEIAKDEIPYPGTLTFRLIRTTLEVPDANTAAFGDELFR